MNIYFMPINLSQWSMFEKVREIGYIETFYATKDMAVGDIALLYVTGRQMPIPIECGVYAFGVILTEPYVVLDESRLVIDVEIVRIKYDRPFIDAAVCKKTFAQVRSTHKIADEHYECILKALNQ